MFGSIWEDQAEVDAGRAAAGHLLDFETLADAAVAFPTPAVFRVLRKTSSSDFSPAIYRSRVGAPDYGPTAVLSSGAYAELVDQALDARQIIKHNPDFDIDQTALWADAVETAIGLKRALDWRGLHSRMLGEVQITSNLIMLGYGGNLRIDTPVANAGTAISATATTIVLAAGASAVDDFYNGKFITILSGTGNGPRAVGISDYVGSTRTATVSAWLYGTPNATSTYTIFTGRLRAFTFAGGADLYDHFYAHGGKISTAASRSNAHAFQNFDNPAASCLDMSIRDMEFENVGVYINTTGYDATIRPAHFDFTYNKFTDDGLGGREYLGYLGINQYNDPREDVRDWFNSWTNYMLDPGYVGCEVIGNTWNVTVYTTGASLNMDLLRVRGPSFGALIEGNRFWNRNPLANAEVDTFADGAYVTISKNFFRNCDAVSKIQGTTPTNITMTVGASIDHNIMLFDPTSVLKVGILNTSMWGSVTGNKIFAAKADASLEFTGIRFALGGQGDWTDPFGEESQATRYLTIAHNVVYMPIADPLTGSAFIVPIGYDTVGDRRSHSIVGPNIFVGGNKSLGIFARSVRVFGIEWYQAQNVDLPGATGKGNQLDIRAYDEDDKLIGGFTTGLGFGDEYLLRTILDDTVLTLPMSSREIMLYAISSATSSTGAPIGIFMARCTVSPLCASIAVQSAADVIYTTGVQGTSGVYDVSTATDGKFTLTSVWDAGTSIGTLRLINRTGGSRSVSLRQLVGSQLQP